MLKLNLNASEYVPTKINNIPMQLSTGKYVAQPRQAISFYLKDNSQKMKNKYPFNTSLENNQVFCLI